MILSALGLAVVAWAAIVLARGGLVGTALLVLLAGSCFGHPFFHVATGPVPLTADRVLLVVLVAQYAVYRRFGGDGADPKPLAKVDYLLGAFLLVLLASTLVHDFRVERWRPLAFFLFFYLMPVVMYWIARQTLWTERAAWWLFGSLGAFSLYLCLTAVAETHGWWAAVFPRYIASAQFEEFLGRGRGPFLNPVANGIVQGVGLCAALLWWPRLDRRGQLVLLALLPLYAWGIYSTLTRSVWMGAALGVLVVLALTLPRVWRGAVLAGAVMAGLLVVVVGWESLLTFKRDKDLDAELTAESAKLRPILATVAWHMFLDRPLVGCGFGQYPHEMLPLPGRPHDRPAVGKSPAVHPAQRLPGAADRDGAVGPGLIRGRAAVVDGRRLAALARGRCAPLGPADGAVVSGLDRRLSAQRHVSRRIDHRHGPHAAVLSGRNRRRAELRTPGDRPCAGRPARRGP